MNLKPQICLFVALTDLSVLPARALTVLPDLTGTNIVTSTNEIIAAGFDSDGANTNYFGDDSGNFINTVDTNWEFSPTGPSNYWQLTYSSAVYYTNNSPVITNGWGIYGDSGTAGTVSFATYQSGVVSGGGASANDYAVVGGPGPFSNLVAQGSTAMTNIADPDGGNVIITNLQVVGPAYMTNITSPAGAAVFIAANNPDGSGSITLQDGGQGRQAFNAVNNNDGTGSLEIDEPGPDQALFHGTPTTDTWYSPLLGAQVAHATPSDYALTDPLNGNDFYLSTSGGANVALVNPVTTGDWAQMDGSGTRLHDCDGSGITNISAAFATNSSTAVTANGSIYITNATTGKIFQILANQIN